MEQESLVTWLGVLTVCACALPFQGRPTRKGGEVNVGEGAAMHNMRSIGRGERERKLRGLDGLRDRIVVCMGSLTGTLSAF